MDRNFALLGLREDATKDEVRQAYELRVRKYRSSDYDDDPDYVRKKISELKNAYEAAYSMAGTSRAYDEYEGNTERQEAADRKDAYEPKPYKPRAYRPEDYDHDKFERDRDRAARRGEDHRFKTPDISKLRDKMDSLKDTVSENVSGLVEEVRKSSEPREESRGSGGVTEETPRPVDIPRLDGSGSGKVIETPVGANKRVYGSDSNTTVKGGSVAGMIIALLVGVVIMFTSMCDDDGSDYYYDDYEDSPYSYTYVTDREDQVYDTAGEANNLLNQQEYADSYSAEVYSDDDIKKAGDRFAKNYLEMDSLEDVNQYLYDNYDEYATDASATYDEQMMQILAFYGFMSEDEAAGLINPYTDKPITDLLSYLKYINKYYKENGLVNGDEES